MAAVTIRNLSEEGWRPKVRAAQHNRSAEAEMFVPRAGCGSAPPFRR